MKKRFLSVVLSFALLLALAPMFSTGAAAGGAAWYTSGSGVDGDPYIISTYEGLTGFATAVNSENGLIGTYVKLADDFPATGELTTQIGSTTAFQGTFDGNNKEIAVAISGNNAGLFGASTGTIKNVGVSGTVTGVSSGAFHVGGIVGTNNGILYNCWNNAAVSGKAQNQVGGIVGLNYSVGSNSGIVLNCCNKGNVSNSDTENSSSSAGGVVGCNVHGSSIGTVNNCYNAGAVTGGKYNKKGGIVGDNASGQATGAVSNCYYLSLIADETAGAMLKDDMQSDTLADALNAVVVTNSYRLHSWAVQSGVNDGYPFFNHVCSIGDDNYYTVVDAIETIQTNTATTIKLLANVTESITIPEGKNIILDLNCKTFKAVSGYAITNNGTLTVVCSADITEDSSLGCTVTNNGTFTVSDMSKCDISLYLKNGKTVAVGSDFLGDMKIVTETEPTAGAPVTITSAGEVKNVMNHITLSDEDYTIKCNSNGTLGDKTDDYLQIVAGCAVEFDTNGGSEIETQFIENGSANRKAVKPQNPTRANSEFAGWFNADGTAFDFNKTIDDDITVYAKWTLNIGSGETVIAVDGDNGTTAKVCAIGDAGMTVTGLEEIARELKAQNADKNVRVTLTAERKTEEGIGNADATDAVKTAAGTHEVRFFSISLEKSINTAMEVVADTDGKIIEVVIPFTDANKYLDAVYRYHNSTLETFTRANTGAVNTFYFDSDSSMLHIFTDKFSIYAIDYFTPVSTTVFHDVSAAPSYSASGYAKNGTISLSDSSASKGDAVAVTVKPDKGYVLDTLTVKDTNGVAVALSKVNDSVYTFSMPNSGVTVFASFVDDGICNQDDTCVYAGFADADTGAWYHNGVHFCVERGYMGGVSDDEFAPDGVVSRAMIVTMLWRMEDSPVVNYAMSFEDIDVDAYYAEAVRWAQSEKIVDGCGADTFNPTGSVTREQLAAIFFRYAAYKGADVSARNELTAFEDENDVSEWALENVKWANAVGLVTGRTETTIVPNGDTTRAEAACMLQRFCENVLAQ